MTRKRREGISERTFAKRVNHASGKGRRGQPRDDPLGMMAGLRAIQAQGGMTQAAVYIKEHARGAPTRLIPYLGEAIMLARTPGKNDPGLRFPDGSVVRNLNGTLTEVKE